MTPLPTFPCWIHHRETKTVMRHWRFYRRSEDVNWESATHWELHTEGLSWDEGIPKVNPEL
jgi:hypothetical protein